MNENTGCAIVVVALLACIGFCTWVGYAYESDQQPPACNCTCKP